MPTSILVVDDNLDAADLLGEALRLVGYIVRVVHTPLEALAVLDDFTPDAALLDIGLPGIDGYALAAELHRRHASLPLIAITGYGREHDRDRALAAGFAEHLAKPATIQDIVTVLDRLLT